MSKNNSEFPEPRFYVSPDVADLERKWNSDPDDDEPETFQKYGKDQGGPRYQEYTNVQLVTLIDANLSWNTVFELAFKFTVAFAVVSLIPALILWALLTNSVN